MSGEREPETGPAAAARALERLDEVTRRLRGECPWDREQDERSIVPHTVEEAYELADAAASGDDDKLVDELGDVLFQVHFLALLLSERGAGDLATVAEQMTEKLIRRHPHVFGGDDAALRDPGDSGEVLASWDRIKREQEGRQAGDPFADVPENLPGLLFARKLQRRAASAGLPGPAADVAEARERLASAAAAVGGVDEAELSGAPTAGEPLRSDSERLIGELLLAAVDLARSSRVDPELALRQAAARMRDSAS